MRDVVRLPIRPSRSVEILRGSLPSGIAIQWKRRGPSSECGLALRLLNHCRSVILILPTLHALFSSHSRRPPNCPVLAVHATCRFTLAPMAFAGCTSLVGVTVPTGVTTLGRQVFTGCVQLAEVQLPTGITRIPVDAFRSCVRLGRMTLPDGVTEFGIGDWGRRLPRVSCPRFRPASVRLDCNRVGRVFRLYVTHPDLDPRPGDSHWF